MIDDLEPGPRVVPQSLLHRFLLLCLVWVMGGLLLSSPSLAAVDPTLEAQVLQILRDHPEVIIESVQAYQTRQEAEQRQAQRVAIRNLPNQPQVWLEDSPRRGTIPATNLLIEFSDFQCPFCARAASEVHDFLEQHGTDVTFVYKHFPLTSIHDQAMPAAQAAWAAQQQGQFWPFHDALFAQQDRLGEDRYGEIAQQLKLNLKQFNRDRNSEAARAAVNRDLALGEQIGLRGTPFFILNGDILDLPLQTDVMVDRLKAG